jgi:hypothetical protein
LDFLNWQEPRAFPGYGTDIALVNRSTLCALNEWREYSGITQNGLAGVRIKHDMPNALVVQEDEVNTQQQQCEYCRHFQKDEYTGYCRIHRAYVAKTFWCPQFNPLNSSLEEA